MKLTTALVAGALLAMSASPLVFAQQTPAPAATPQQKETRQIHRDNRDIRQDKRDVRQDQRQVNKDVSQGKFKKAKAQEKDIAVRPSSKDTLAPEIIFASFAFD